VVVRADHGRQRRIDLDAGVLERLEEPRQDAAEQGDEGDRDVHGGEALLDARHRLASTMILPAIVWCAIPQYSWQMIGYSPGVPKRACAWPIGPGRSITFTLWRGTKSPWTRSLLVAQKCTVEPAGTRI